METLLGRGVGVGNQKQVKYWVFSANAQERERMKIKSFLHESASQLGWDHQTMETWAFWKAKGFPEVTKTSSTGQVWHLLPIPYPQHNDFASSFFFFLKTAKDVICIKSPAQHDSTVGHIPTLLLLLFGNYTTHFICQVPSNHFY